MTSTRSTTLHPRRPGALRLAAGPAALAAVALVVAGCVAASSPSPVPAGASGAPVSSAAASSSLAPSSTASGSPSGAGAQMPVPSAPSSMTLETPQPRTTASATESTLAPGGGGTGSGAKGNYLIVCLGTSGGPPCVPASQGGYVIAAERALTSSDRGSIAGATFADSTCAAAGATCGAGDSGLGIVTFTLSGGAKDRVLVVKHADGTLGAIALP